MFGLGRWLKLADYEDAKRVRWPGHMDEVDLREMSLAADAAMERLARAAGQI